MSNTATVSTKRIDTFGITWVLDHRRAPDGSKHPMPTRTAKASTTAKTAQTLTAN